MSTQNTANIVTVTSANYTQEVEKSAVPILVDFWAPWCGPCRAVAPILEQLAAKYDGKVKIGKVNVDEQQELAVKFRVMSIPTLILFKDGKVVQQMVGLRAAQELDDMIKKAM
ncbi:MAG: thioredoxin [Clostridiales bacterium]|nr:thioredoxin [Clostridiales bacterium]